MQCRPSAGAEHAVSQKRCEVLPLPTQPGSYAAEARYRPAGCKMNEKYALTSPITSSPVMINVRDRMMCPTRATTTPNPSAAVNAGR